MEILEKWIKFNMKIINNLKDNNNNNNNNKTITINKNQVNNLKSVKCNGWLKKRWFCTIWKKTLKLTCLDVIIINKKKLKIWGS